MMRGEKSFPHSQHARQNRLNYHLIRRRINGERGIIEHIAWYEPAGLPLPNRYVWINERARYECSSGAPKTRRRGIIFGGDQSPENRQSGNGGLRHAAAQSGRRQEAAGSLREYEVWFQNLTPSGSTRQDGFLGNPGVIISRMNRFRFKEERRKWARRRESLRGIPFQQFFMTGLVMKLLQMFLEGNIWEKYLSTNDYGFKTQNRK